MSGDRDDKPPKERVGDRRFTPAEERFVRWLIRSAIKRLETERAAAHDTAGPDPQNR